MSFPYRLKKLRKEYKWTQEELGAKLNLTKVSISGYENGNRTPDMDTLTKIADIFDVSIDYLVGKSNVRSRDTLVMEETESYSTKLPLLEQIFFDGFLEASKEEREEIIRYWHEEVKKRKKAPPAEKDGSFSAWDLKDD